MAKQYTLYFDGACKGNPGPAAGGYAIVRNTSEGKEEPIAQGGVAIKGKSTNNVAEYTGLIAGLNKAIELGLSDMNVRGDSKVIVMHISGQWKVKAAHLLSMRNYARELLSRTRSLSNVEWIPRNLNVKADREANLAVPE
jgi:ribonuclease HI